MVLNAWCLRLFSQVTNDGQMDLFMNFACSCRFHSLALDNVVVFAASR